MGVSIGVERVLTIMEKRLEAERAEKGVPSNVQVRGVSHGCAFFITRSHHEIHTSHIDTWHSITQVAVGAVIQTPDIA